MEVKTPARALIHRYWKHYVPVTKRYIEPTERSIRKVQKRYPELKLEVEVNLRDRQWQEIVQHRESLLNRTMYNFIDTETEKSMASREK
jgi:hypothetical protein